MTVAWNNTPSQSRPSRVWPHLFSNVVTSGALNDAGLIYTGSNSPEIVPSGLSQFLWSAAAYSVNLSVSIGSTSLSINKTKTVGTRDLGFALPDSDLVTDAILGEGEALLSIRQRLEVLSRSYPADYDDEFYVGSAGVRRIDSCTAFYVSEDLPDPESETPEEDFFRNEMCVIMHGDFHYPKTEALSRENVAWFPHLNKWATQDGCLLVRARIRETFDSTTFDVWSNILGPSDTSTTIDAFGGDFILGHNPELTVSGNMSVSGHLPFE